MRGKRILRSCDTVEGSFRNFSILYEIITDLVDIFTVINVGQMIYLCDAVFTERIDDVFSSVFCLSRDVINETASIKQIVRFFVLRVLSYLYFLASDKGQAIQRSLCTKIYLMRRVFEFSHNPKLLSGDDAIDVVGNKVINLVVCHRADDNIVIV